jgi:hypothetical protein
MAGKQITRLASNVPWCSAHCQKYFAQSGRRGEGESGADLGAGGGCVRERATGRRPPRRRRRGAPWSRWTCRWTVWRVGREQWLAKGDVDKNEGPYQSKCAKLGRMAMSHLGRPSQEKPTSGLVYQPPTSSSQLDLSFPNFRSLLLIGKIVFHTKKKICT